MRSIFEAGFQLAGETAEEELDALPEIPGLRAEEEQVAVPGYPPGMAPAYLTTSGTRAGGTRLAGTNLAGDMQGPLGFIFPTDSPLGYFAAAATGVAIASVPGALLSRSKLGPTKGYAAGAAVSAAILTALYFLNRPRSSEKFSAQISVKGCG